MSTPLATLAETVDEAARTATAIPHPVAMASQPASLPFERSSTAAATTPFPSRIRMAVPTNWPQRVESLILLTVKPDALMPSAVAWISSAGVAYES